MDLKEKLKEFLDVSLSQRELSLCIIPSSKVTEYNDFFIDQGFKVSNDILVFLQTLKSSNNSVFFVKEKDLKNLYDISVQFPTGQISFFDTPSMNTIWVSPVYENSRNIVILENNLLNKNNENILSPFGITYQE